jgi:nitrite reductase (NADH) large subunit
MARRLVCFCNFVEDKEIVAYLKKGVSTTIEIQKCTRAGTMCGRCLPEIDQLVEKYKKEKPNQQQKQLKIGF